MEKDALAKLIMDRAPGKPDLDAMRDQHPGVGRATKHTRIEGPATVQTWAPPSPFKRLVSAIFGGLLAAGCTTPPARYHDVVAHPFELRRSGTEVALANRERADIDAVARDLAAARPNNGSTFTLTADNPTATRLLAVLRREGVRREDILLVAAAQPVSLARTDRTAIATGCYGPPESVLGFGRLDDGYQHDNANSRLLGCAIQRNIAAMSDDPRALVAADAMTGRDGARAADTYDKWIKGQPTPANQPLPSAKTASTSVDTGPGASGAK